MICFFPHVFYMKGSLCFQCYVFFYNCCEISTVISWYMCDCTETEVRRRKTDLTPTVPERDSTPPPRKGKPGRAYSMSRLDILSQPRPAPKPLLPAESLRRGTARSMVSLGPPRPTRAERLRRKAREQQARSQSLDQPSSPGKCVVHSYKVILIKLVFKKLWSVLTRPNQESFCKNIFFIQSLLSLF